MHSAVQNRELAGRWSVVKIAARQRGKKFTNNCTLHRVRQHQETPEDRIALFLFSYNLV